MDNQNPNHVRKEGEKVTSIFPTSGDTSFIFAYKKTERLTTALFMVTDFIAPSDSLRTQLRDKGLSLLGCIIDLYVSPSSHAFNVACAKIGEVVAMLTVLSRVGYISPMNYRLLEEEYSALARFLREREQQFIVRPTMLDTSFFGVGIEAPDIKKSEADTPAEATQGADQAPSPYAPGRSSTPVAASTPRAQQPSQAGNKGHSESSRASSIEPARKKKDRRAIILGVLQEKDKITINDILPLISGVSEKTVQRELTALVEQGLLRKEGKKRWSIYMLA